MSPYAPFEWIVAFRFMREGLMQTLLIIVGVGLGGGVIVFMSALLSGLQANVVRRTLNYQAPIVILPPDQVARPLRATEGAEIAAQVQPRSQRLRSIDQWQKIRDEVERMPEVVAVTPIVAIAERRPSLVASPAEVARIVEAPMAMFLPDASPR